MTWKREPLEDYELTELIDATESTENELIIRTLAHTGLRADEFAHLTSDWIEWTDDEIRVPPQDGDWSPKTTHSARLIPLRDPDTLRLLREHFKREESIPWSRTTIWRRVKAVATNADLQKKVTPHVLRHTYGSLIASKGASAQYIRQTMGHADLSSANAYIEFSGRQLHDEADTLW